ncbi:MAG: HNH endonuclease [Crocinitomicaceae bacterium]|nr:HNH endonuclease [Crocinitomicaceae bacterium]
MIEKHIKDIIDYAEPQMDVYEFAIYMYLIRHTRLLGMDEKVFGFKSIRKTMVIGVGEKGTPMSEGTCYLRLKSLESKGFIKILDSVFSGQRIKVLFPSEIDGLIEVIEQKNLIINIEEIDFFEIAENRNKILERDNKTCFYCFRKLSNDGYVIEHVISRPEGNNSYRNLVSSCRTCNNKKDNLPVKEFLRKLYRDNIISDTELTIVSEKLEKLKNGELKPKI